MNGSSKILEHIISNQKLANDKTRIGYKSEVTNASTKKEGTNVKNISN